MALHSLLLFLLLPTVLYALEERLPLFDGDRMIAEYNVILDDSGNQLQAIDLLSNTPEIFLSPELIIKIQKLPRPQKVKELKALGLNLTYDPKQLKIYLSLPTKERNSETVSIQNRPGPQSDRPTDVVPEKFSGLINLYPQYSYGTLNEFQGQAEGAFRISNFVLIQETQVVDESPVRRDSKIIYDFPKYYLRTELGDVQATSSDILTPVNVLGVSAHTDFGMTLFGRPLPNPSTELVLDRRARVNAYSRGQLLQSLIIGPGRFRLQDFQFINGITEVVFDIQEYGGKALSRRRKISALRRK